MAKPKAVVEIRTAASVRDAATLFQAAMQQGALQRLLTGPTEFGQPHGTPFDAVDVDPPAFQVYAAVPTSRNNQSVIHLYAWDRGAERELKVVAMGGMFSFGQHARKMVRRFVAELQSVAPATTVAGV